MKYINFNDETLPIGKRKQAYVKWAVSQGTDIISAKKQANKKFGFEKKPGIFAFITDHGRMGQKSFKYSEIFDEYDLRRYESSEWKEVDNEDEKEKLKKKYKSMGWDVVEISLIP
jgi:hypothetical protein